MIHFVKIKLAFLMLFLGFHSVEASATGLRKERKSNEVLKKTLNQKDTTQSVKVQRASTLASDTVAVVQLSKFPFISLEQIMKGTVSGVYVQEPSAEPGTSQQNIIVRGLSRPVLTAKNFKENSPLIVLDGIQLINETDIIYNVQNDESQPIGSATNIMSLFDLDNIESITVLKDASQIAKYGPRAANGVIYVQSKKGKGGNKSISINGYAGIVVPGNTETINAEYERNLRQPFYDRYAGSEELLAYPSYLSDSSNVNYYGPSNWVDSYYKTSPIYSVNGALTGGTSRSNFRLFANHTQNASGADDTKFNRSYGNFNINMLPTTWLKVDGNIQIGKLARNRNRSLTERYTETKYFPDISTPLAPNKALYGLYLDNFDKLTLDDNNNTSILGSLGISIKILDGFDFNTRVSMDYNENRRDIFWPSTLMENNNYASNYLGYNERFMVNSHLNYFKKLNVGKLFLEGGLMTQADRQKYNYIQAYRGPNDYIKVNKVDGRRNEPDYLVSIGFIPYLYSDKVLHNVISGYFKADYELEALKVGALIRRDGSSWQQLSEKYFTSYAVDATYDLNYLLKEESIDYLKIKSSYGRLGNMPNSDVEAAGPQYTSNLGWQGNSLIMSNNGISTISRPYTSGWVGYDVPWAYTDLFNVGLEMSIFNQFSASIDYYIKNSKNMQFAVPTVAESGYKFEYASGMEVKNQGIDITLNYTLPNTTSGFGWNSSLNIGYNTNKLTKLPNGLESLIVGKNKLMVGDRIDRYWLLENKGIYSADLDVPVSPSDYKILTYNGTEMKAGDPRWVDQDGNYDINNNDRVLMGNILPKWAGGFYNQFRYKNFDLSMFLYFNLGRDIINQQAAKYYDFANVSESKNIYGVREITYWEKHFDESTYPLYNPWSSVKPYQAEQDMFLEDGSFLKLKNLSLGYDFTKLLDVKSVNRIYVYLTGSNLYTYTKYSGRDPELVNYYGYDTGNGIRFPRTYTLGFKLDF